jgi:signal peptidase II
VKRRLIILFSVGIAIALVDQWTKFLVVKHLTPSFPRGVELSIAGELSAFYDGAEHPCVGARFSDCPTIQVIDGFWNWRYVENPGAAWGLFAGARDNLRVPFFLIISVVAIGFIINYVRKLRDDQKLQLWGLSLVFGGAIGNFIDRLHLSYVIDFIDWYVGTAHWPTFNVADSGISTGVGLLVLDWILDSVRKRASQRAPEGAEA